MLSLDRLCLFQMPLPVFLTEVSKWVVILLSGNINSSERTISAVMGMLGTFHSGEVASPLRNLKQLHRATNPKVPPKPVLDYGVLLGVTPTYRHVNLRWLKILVSRSETLPAYFCSRQAAVQGYATAADKQIPSVQIDKWVEFIKFFGGGCGRGAITTKIQSVLQLLQKRAKRISHKVGHMGRT